MNELKRSISIFLCILLCSCGMPTQDVPERTQQSSSASNSAVAVSESPLVTESPAVTGSPVPTKRAVVPEKVTPGIVIDETGKKRKLKLGNVNVKNVMVYPPDMWFPTDYAQVVNNHYYFLRADGNGNYTIYRDKGKLVGEFSVKKGIVAEFVLYKNKFYAVIAKSYGEERGQKLVEIDLKRHITIDLCNIDKKGENENVFVFGMYRGLCYWKYGKESAFDLKKKEVVTDSMVSPLSDRRDLIDGKMYSVEIKSGKKIQIYSFDLKSSERKKVLEFECANKLSDDDIHYMDWGVKIDEDYIYCLDYLIPRRGGKITKLPDRIIKSWDDWISDDPTTTIFTYNKKFIFYMDGRGDIHRINKITKEDVVISDPDTVGVMDIQCTDDGLYIQEFDPYISPDYECDESYNLWGSTKELSDACNLYYMDFNGENVKQIWKD